MKNKGISLFFIALFVFLFTSPFAAYAQNSKSRFQSYLHKHYYETALKNAASNYALAQIDECDVRNSTLARNRYDLLQRPVFYNKKRHPFEGIWIERVNLMICNQSFNLDITVISNDKGKMPRFDISKAKN